MSSTWSRMCCRLAAPTYLSGPNILYPLWKMSSSVPFITMFHSQSSPCIFPFAKLRAMLAPCVGVHVRLDETHLSRHLSAKMHKKMTTAVWDLYNRQQRRAWQDVTGLVADVLERKAWSSKEAATFLLCRHSTRTILAWSLFSLWYCCHLVCCKMESICLTVQATVSQLDQHTPGESTASSQKHGKCLCTFLQSNTPTHILPLSTVSRARFTKTALENSHLMDWTWRQQRRQIP